MKAKKIFKMKKQENNFAYIDGANLHKGIESSGWKLDYRKFRVWLLEKYGVKKAYIFIGLIPEAGRGRSHLYSHYIIPINYVNTLIHR